MRSSLRFSVGAEDMTAQSQKDTQARIDAKLGTGSNLLQRACFYGQHSTEAGALLGLTDARLKTELSPLVLHSKLWVAAAAASRVQERELRKAVAALEVELRIRREEVAGCEQRHAEAVEGVKRLEEEVQQTADAFLREEQAYAAELGLPEAGTDGHRGGGAH